MWTPRGRAWAYPPTTDSIEEQHNFEDVTDSRLEDLPFKHELRSKHEIQVVSEAIDERGVHRAIKDGLEDDGVANLSDEEGQAPSRSQAADAEEADHPTTDEERELPGQRRPPKGAGWWGMGRPLDPHRKGKS